MEAVVGGHVLGVVDDAAAESGEEAIAVLGVVVDLNVAGGGIGHVDAPGAVGGDPLRIGELAARLDRRAERAAEAHQLRVRRGGRKHERADRRDAGGEHAQDSDAGGPFLRAMGQRADSSDAA